MKLIYLSCWYHFSPGFLQYIFFKLLIDRRHHLVTSTTDKLPSYLKESLLLMIATFNHSLLSLLEKMIGIKVLRENFLCSGREKMARRNIKINMNFVQQKTRFIKKFWKIHYQII